LTIRRFEDEKIRGGEIERKKTFENSTNKQGATTKVNWNNTDVCAAN